MTGFKSSLVVADKLVLEYYKNLKSASASPLSTTPSTPQSLQSTGYTTATAGASVAVAASSSSRCTTVRTNSAVVSSLLSRKSESQLQLPRSVSIAGVDASASAGAGAGAGVGRDVVSTTNANDIAVLDDILGAQTTAMESTSSAVDVKSSKTIPVAPATSTSNAAAKPVNHSRNQLRSALKSPNRRKPVNPDPETVPLGV